jgi:hypothetical protein
MAPRPPAAAAIYGLLPVLLVLVLVLVLVLLIISSGV